MLYHTCGAVRNTHHLQNKHPPARERKKNTVANTPIATTPEGKNIYQGKTYQENGTTYTDLCYEDGTPYTTLYGTHP